MSSDNQPSQEAREAVKGLDEARVDLVSEPECCPNCDADTCDQSDEELESWKCGECGKTLCSHCALDDDEQLCEDCDFSSYGGGE